MALAATRPVSAPTTISLDDEQDVAAVLTALNDADCQRILSAIGSEARSAAELCERCGLPRSTTYRKLERLVDAGLVEEGLRIRASGHHTAEYERTYDDVHVTFGDEGVTVDLVTGVGDVDEGQY